MKSLIEDMKTQQFQPIYLLYGEERYLKKQYKERLTEGIRGEGDSINCNYFEGKGVNTKEIIDLAETMPFFAPTRLIVIENSGFFKNATLDLAEYISEIPDTTYLLFVEEEVDKRGKLYKEVKKYGRVVELGKQDGKTLYRWIGGLFQKDNRTIQEKTVRYLVEKVGEDMTCLQGEVEKLVCYTMGRDEITIEDVDDICVTQVSSRIFDMVSAVAEKRQNQALAYYYDLLALKEPPMRILFLLVRQFRMLYQVKSFIGTGISNKEIASKMGIQHFLVGKYQTQGKYFQKEELRAIIEEAAEIEEAVKTGRLSDKLAVEIFVVKYSMT